MSEPERPSGGAMRLAGVGMELAAAVGGACALGYWIDRHYQTSPWGLLTCALLGIAGGLYNLIRQAVHEMVLPKKDQRTHDRDSSGNGLAP